MRLMVVSHNFEPFVNPRSLRVTALCKAWEQAGHEVHIVCANAAGIDHLRYTQGLKVHRVGGLEAATVSGANNKSVLKDLLRPIYRATVKQLVWPDSNFRWINPAVKKCLELNSKYSFDGVISISHPFTSHVVAYSFLEKINFNLKWFMDSGDPFSFIDGVKINNQFIFKSKNYSFEAKCLGKVSHSFVTTEETKALYESHFKLPSEKTSVIGPLLRDGFDFNPSQNINKWVFAGTLYKNIRNPKPLLQAFEAFSKNNAQAELHIYGSINDCQDVFNEYQHLLDKTIFLHGLIKSEELKAKLSLADVLINIGNTTTYQLPSKVIEYISLGKPIINFTSVAGDSSSQLLKKYPLAISHGLQDSEMSLMLALESLRSNLHVDRELVDGLTKDFKLDVVSGQYLRGISGYIS